MKKLTFLLSLFTLMMFEMGLGVVAQPNDRWKAGSALLLTDTIETLYCFAETEANPWFESEKANMIASLESAQRWLAQQAGQWNVPLLFKNSPLQSGETIRFDSILSGTGSGKEQVDWIKKVVQHADYRNSRQACRNLSRKFHNKNILVVVFAHADGISYAMRYAKGMSKKKYFMEGILIYQRYDNGAEMPVSCIVSHEILHLYGAWDLYRTYAQTLEKQSKARELYPDDIMLRVDYAMETLKIDRLTAWLLGWNPTEEEIFEWFRPEDYRK
ncbi:MAG: hypothetical protein WC341_06930 [Bacteroidales bacterium]|jgi:hypothetical protein